MPLFLMVMFILGGGGLYFIYRLLDTHILPMIRDSMRKGKGKLPPGAEVVTDAAELALLRDFRDPGQGVLMIRDADEKDLVAAHRQLGSELRNDA